VNSPHDAHELGEAHVTEFAVDFVAGRLEGAVLHKVQDHLEMCEGCRGDFAMAVAIADAGEGIGHISADRIAELSNDGAKPDADESSHLQRCSRCSDEVTELQEIAPLPEVARPASRGTRSPRMTPRSSRSSRSMGRWLAPVAVAAAVLLFLQPWKAGDVDLSSLVSLDALPVRITRDFPVDGSFEAIRREALENYRDTQWDAAEIKFREALVLREGDGEMRLYLGSAYLLNAKDLEALAPLRRAADDPQNPRILRNEALWVLGNAYLAQNDASAAEAVLRELAEHEQPLREKAQQVLSSLE
jgi:hypothetical protein